MVMKNSKPFQYENCNFRNFSDVFHCYKNYSRDRFDKIRTDIFNLFLAFVEIA